MTMSSQAAVLVDYSFNGGSLAPTLEASGFTATSISTPTFNNSFTTDWIYAQGNQTANSEAAASDDDVEPGDGEGPGNDYFVFTLTPDSGTYSLDGLDYDTAFYESNGNSNTSYTSNTFVRSSLDSYTANLGLFTEPGQTTTSPTFTPRSVDLSGAAFQNLSVPVTFRIYIFDNISGGNRLSSIDNLSVSAIPEPSSLVFLLTGAVAVFCFRRKSTRSAR